MALTNDRASLGAIVVISQCDHIAWLFVQYFAI